VGGISDISVGLFKIFAFSFTAYQDLVLCYIMLHGLVDLNCSEFFMLSDCIHTLGHNYKLFKPLCSLDVRKYLKVFFLLIVFIFHSFHLFCKKQFTERNCTVKLENWLKYCNSSNMQLQIKLPVQIGLKVSVNDLLRMLTGERSIVYRLGWHF